MHQVPGITYWWSNSFVRVQSFTYYAPFITYTFNKWNAAPGTRHYQPWFSNICSWSGALKYMHIYIYLVGSPPLFCAEEAFLTLSATTKTYHVYVDKKYNTDWNGHYYLNLMHIPYVRTWGHVHTPHTHWYDCGDSHMIYKCCWIMVRKCMKNCRSARELMPNQRAPP